MTNTIEKVMNLIKKTGDRCIVVPEGSDDAYAILSLADYERIALGKSDVAGLTEDQLLDKINRDIAVWKSQHESARSAQPAQQKPLVQDLPAQEYQAPEIENRANHSAETSDIDPWSRYESGQEYNEEETEEEPYYFEKV